MLTTAHLRSSASAGSDAIEELESSSLSRLAIGAQRGLGHVSCSAALDNGAEVGYGDKGAHFTKVHGCAPLLLENYQKTSIGRM